MVAKYFRDQGFWMADRRLREGRADDQGDIDGVPFTTVQVKYVEANRYPMWVLDTLKQRDTAGTPLCLLVRRIPRKPVEQWEALMPPTILFADFEDSDGPVRDDDALNEQDPWTWTRMDLRLAVNVLKRVVRVLGTVPDMSWDPYSSTTSPTSRSTESGA